MDESEIRGQLKGTGEERPSLGARNYYEILSPKTQSGRQFVVEDSSDREDYNVPKDQEESAQTSSLLDLSTDDEPVGNQLAFVARESLGPK